MHLNIKRVVFLIIVVGLFSTLTAYILTKTDTPTQGTVHKGGISVSGSQYTSEQPPLSYQSLTPQNASAPTSTQKTDALVTLKELLSTYQDDSSLDTGITSKPTIDSGVAETLRVYGNAAGTIISAHLTPSRDEAAILDTFIKKPTNTEAKRAFLNLAHDYQLVGSDLKALVPPDTLRSAHEVFANVYVQIGDAMEQFSQSDASSKSADIYNEKVFLFPDAYLNIAQTLRAYGVTFRDDEPGSLFTLPF